MSRKTGFTIIELLVVITIIGILLAAATQGINQARISSRDAGRLGDITLIAKAIDLSASITGGIYPKNVANYSLKNSPTHKTMCANEIYGGANPNQVNISQFNNRKFPVDPKAENPLMQGCQDMRNGYTYSTLYGRPTLTALPSVKNTAAQQQVDYTLEVGLERQAPPDDTVFKKQTDISELSQVNSENRNRYILNGKYCASEEACYQ